MNETNWVSKSVNVTEADIKTLEKAHRQEKAQIKKGYGWYRLNKLHKIFVPFGKDGKPTKKGWEKIKIYKSYLGLP